VSHCDVTYDSRIVATAHSNANLTQCARDALLQHRLEILEGRLVIDDLRANLTEIKDGRTMLALVIVVLACKRWIAGVLRERIVLNERFVELAIVLQHSLEVSFLLKAILCSVPVLLWLHQWQWAIA
jgi:hypothetical protein